MRERNLAQGMELHSATETQNAVGIFRADNEFLGELQERDRNIFLQRYWFATPIKEISKKYAMNLNTVKASLFRSRNKLKALLEKEGVLL